MSNTVSSRFASSFLASASSLQRLLSLSLLSLPFVSLSLPLVSPTYLNEAVIERQKERSLCREKEIAIAWRTRTLLYVWLRRRSSTIPHHQLILLLVPFAQQLSLLCLESLLLTGLMIGVMRPARKFTRRATRSSSIHSAMNSCRCE